MCKIEWAKGTRSKYPFKSNLSTVKVKGAILIYKTIDGKGYDRPNRDYKRVEAKGQPEKVDRGAHLSVIKKKKIQRQIAEIKLFMSKRRQFIGGKRIPSLLVQTA